MGGSLNLLQRLEFLDGALDSGSLGLSLDLDHLGNPLCIARYPNPSAHTTAKTHTGDPPSSFEILCIPAAPAVPAPINCLSPIDVLAWISSLPNASPTPAPCNAEPFANAPPFRRVEPRERPPPVAVDRIVEFLARSDVGSGVRLVLADVGANAETGGPGEGPTPPPAAAAVATGARAPFMPPCCW